MLQVNVSKEGSKAVLALSGRFNFEAHRAFRDAYTPVLGEAAVTTLVLDFRSVDYMDSSALGMLLMLRERLGGTGKTMSLTHCTGTVKDVLNVANFGKIFKIE
jgi:anti-anti-sigma factor